MLFFFKCFKRDFFFSVGRTVLFVKMSKNVEKLSFLFCFDKFFKENENRELSLVRHVLNVKSSPSLVHTFMSMKNLDLLTLSLVLFPQDRRFVFIHYTSFGGSVKPNRTFWVSCIQTYDIYKLTLPESIVQLIISHFKHFHIAQLVINHFKDFFSCARIQQLPQLIIKHY